jgi:hypothetical protein
MTGSQFSSFRLRRRVRTLLIVYDRESILFVSFRAQSETSSYRLLQGVTFGDFYCFWRGVDSISKSSWNEHSYKKLTCILKAGYELFFEYTFYVPENSITLNTLRTKQKITSLLHCKKSYQFSRPLPGCH